MVSTTAVAVELMPATNSAPDSILWVGTWTSRLLPPPTYLDAGVVALAYADELSDVLGDLVSILD